MEAVFRVVAVLLVVVTSSTNVLARSHREGKQSSSLQAIRDDGMTLESFMEEGSDDVSMFGVDILQEFHLRMLECKMNISKLDHHYQVRLSKLLKYYHNLEKAVKVPGFHRLTNSNRQDVEKNFHGVMQTQERESMEKLGQARKTCRKDMSTWLEGKLAESVLLAKSLIRRKTTVFEDLLEKIRLFQSKLYSHRTTCARSGGDVNTTITCDPNDLQLLLNFTSTLIGRVNYVRDLYLSDDEDLADSNRNRLGSGDMEYDEPHFDEPHFDTQESSPSRSRMADNSISSEESEQEVTEERPSSSEVSSPSAVGWQPEKTAPQQSPRSGEQNLHRGNIEADMEQTTPTGSSTDLTTRRPDSFAYTHLTGSKEGQPTPVSAATGFPISDNEQVNTEELEGTTSIETIQAEQTPVSDGRSLNLPSSPQSQEQSQTTAKSGQEADEENIVILDGPEQPVNGRLDRTHSGTGHQVLVVLVVLVAVVLLAVLVMAAVLAFFAVKKRQLHKSGYVRVLLTSETEATNETLEGIKRDGYVNPTYKFYTRC